MEWRGTSLVCKGNLGSGPGRSSCRNDDPRGSLEESGSCCEDQEGSQWRVRSLTDLD